MRTIYKFIEPKTSIDSITSDTVDNFILSCRRELNINSVTLNTYLRALKTILYFFMEKIDVDKDKFVIAYNRWKAGEITARASMKELGIKASTFYRLVKAYEKNFV